MADVRKLIDALKVPVANQSNPYTRNGIPEVDLAETGKFVNSFMPISGDVQAGIEAAKDIKNKKYASALLNSVGLLPFIPAMGGMIKSPYFKESIKEGYGKVIESPYGKISILSNNPHSPKTHSVTDFFVDESQRNKGYGQELLDEALRQYPTDIGAQVSSSPSAKAFYNKGFRLNSNLNANLNDILDEINNYSSAYMVK